MVVRAAPTLDARPPRPWQDAIDGDDRAGQQALRIVQEIGKTAGASGPIRVEASSSAPARERHQGLTRLSDDEWLRRYEIARTEVLAFRPDGVPAEGDS